MDGSAGAMLTKDEQNALIVALYRGPKLRGSVKQLADSFGWTISHLNSRARTLRAYESTSKRLNYDDKELLIIEQCAGKSVRDIQRALAREGYKRSLQALIKQRWAMGLDPRQERVEQGVYNTIKLADALNTSPTTVARWVSEGRLVAKRTTPTYGSGERNAYEIKSADVRRFLAMNPDTINLKTVPQSQFLAMLLGDLA